MMPMLGILFAISFVLGGITCLSDSNNKELEDFLDRSLDYDDSSIWMDEEEDLKDGDDDSFSLSSSNDADSSDADSSTPKPIEKASNYPKNSVLDLLNVMKLTSPTVPPRKQPRLISYMTDLYTSMATFPQVTHGHRFKGPGYTDTKESGNTSDASIRAVKALKDFLHWNGTYSAWFNISNLSWSRIPEQVELVLSPRHGGRIVRYRRGKIPKTPEENEEEDGGKRDKADVWQKMLVRKGRHARPYFVNDVTDQIHEWIASFGEIGPEERLPLRLDTYANHVHRPSDVTRPFLVLYYGIKHNTLLQGPEEEPTPFPPQRIKHPVLQRGSRAAVAPSPSTSSMIVNKCGLRDWYLSFKELGWDNWVMKPAGVYLNYCAGECPSILMQSAYRASNHAMLRGIYRSQQPFGNQLIPSACCIPTKLLPETIMYLENEQVIIRRLDGTVAAECGCQ